jgi:protein gp37
MNEFEFEFLVFNATFSNISAISWRPVLVVEEAGENHRPWRKQLVNFITCGCESSAPFFVIYKAGCEPPNYEF